MIYPAVRSPFKIGIALSCLIISACTSPYKMENVTSHQFTLEGGHFFGPGPIEPDTPLPIGYLRNIKFDVNNFYGYAEFENTGSPDSFLSDGKTAINQNIDAGRLEIGDGSNPVLLVAIDGGSNKGREYYRLDDQYRMVWTVDIALDPGFADGIIRVDNFILTTGVIKIDQSLQTERNIPGGYDQAGTLKSGQYLTGRLGDYNQDGFMDGIVVAAPRVPLESNMLPGSPVGNRRGFKTDVPIEAHLACELTLRSILHFEEPINDLIGTGNVEEITKMLNEINERIEIAQKNMDNAVLGGSWNPTTLKQQGFLISDRLETVKTLNFIALSFIENYPVYGGKLSSSVVDVIQKMFRQLDGVIKRVESANVQTRTTLPKV